MENLNERQNELLTLLQDHKFMTVSDLSKHLYASEATIRRDLQKLDQMNLINRSHGGASPSSTVGDYPLAMFNKTNVNEKRAIAIKAARLVRDRDVIFLDATSTVAHLLDCLRPFKSLTIFTNGLETAQLAASITSETYLVGGKVRGVSSCCYGAFAESFLGEVYFDSMFFSAPALSADGELTHYSPDLIPLIRSVMQRSRQRYLMCISQKYGNILTYRICNCSELSGVISDKALPPHIKQAGLEEA